MKNIESLRELYDYSVMRYSNNLMSKMLDSDVEYTYSNFRIKCEELSLKLSKYGVGAGDKVAILSQNMPNWGLAFFTTVAFGRVSVPILPDSSANEVDNILQHSQTKAIFISKRLFSLLSERSREAVSMIIDVETLEVLKGESQEFAAAKVPAPEELATIIYTSGTTGNAKGVMLSHRNLASCVVSCYHTKKRDERDRWLSILPMSHTLELTIGLLYPAYCGASVYYMSKPPVPKLLLSAMQEVRPTTMLSVPLIIEKIYRDSIVPTIRKSPTLSWLDKNMNWLLCRLIGLKLRKTFGGKLDFFGIGGAKLDVEVEKFLLKARFPYAVGYGLTETSPLLSFTLGKTRVPGSIGVPVYGVELKLDNINPQTGEGEIVAKGPNVMMGYYKDAERTAKVFNSDGWFKTNDLAVLDAKGNYSIRGRLSNMILGSSGENIYPEEIEQVINNIDVVDESIVLSRGNKLVALVTFNEDVLDWDHSGEAEFLKKVEECKSNILSIVNGKVNRSSRLSAVQVLQEPFEKTATRKIRRFKYVNVEGI